MKTYVFNLPDKYDLNKCFVKFDKGKIIVDTPIDHGIFERATAEIKELNDWKAAYGNIGMGEE